MAVTALDSEIINFLNNAGCARTYQIAAWVNASPAWTTKRLGALRKSGYLTCVEMSARLTHEDGRERTTRVYVWHLLKAAAAEIVPTTIPGSEQVIHLGVVDHEPRKAALDHTLAMVDVAIGYRRIGAQVAWERQILASERKTLRTEAKRDPYWISRLSTVDTDGRLRALAGTTRQIASHRPDLGVVLANGLEVSVEIEIAPKDPRIIRTAILSVAQNPERARLQAWHIFDGQTMGRFRQAIEGVKDPSGRVLLPPLTNEGGFAIQWMDAGSGVHVTHDQRIRFRRERFGPARVGDLGAFADAFVDPITAIFPATTHMGWTGKTTDTAPAWRTMQVNPAAVLLKALGAELTAKTLGTTQDVVAEYAKDPTFDLGAAAPEHQRGNVRDDVAHRLLVAHRAWVRASAALGRDVAARWWVAKNPALTTPQASNPATAILRMLDDDVDAVLRALPPAGSVALAGDLKVLVDALGAKTVAQTIGSSTARVEGFGIENWDLAAHLPVAGRRAARKDIRARVGVAVSAWRRADAVLGREGAASWWNAQNAAVLHPSCPTPAAAVRYDLGDQLEAALVALETRRQVTAA